jgi:tetratricopeptide (TPR) repeat protein
VCAGGLIEPGDVVDLQSQLVEKSLVVMEASGERYRMLDTVRAYALEKLDASGDEAVTRQRHLDFYSQFVEQLRPKMLGPDQGACMISLDHERENILGAHAWCDRNDGSAETDLSMVFALKFYWLNRGLLGLGYRVTSEALARPEAQRRTLWRCRGLADAGQICYFMGRYAEAHELLQQSLSIARELDDNSRVVVALQLLGMVELALGKPDAALARCEEAVGLARTSSNTRTLAATMNMQAQVLRAQGALDRAYPLYTECLSLMRELRDDESVAIGLLNLAMVAVLRDQPSAARHLLEEVLTIFDRIGSKAMGQSLLEICAGLAVAEGDLRLGAEFFGAAEAQADRSELRRDPADQAFLSAAIAQARDVLGPLATESESVGRSLGYDEATQRARRWLQSTPGRVAPTQP